MGDRIFLSIDESRSAFYRWSGDRLAQVAIERRGEESPVGAVVLGRVIKLEPSLNAAFVEIGLDRPGLLPLKKQGRSPSEGDAIIVQVRRDAREEKGVRLTTSLRTKVNAEEAARGKQPPAILVPAPTLWQQALESLAPEQVESITCDRRVDVAAIEEWCGRHHPGLVGRTGFLARRDWIPSCADIADAVAEALNETVQLPGGGQLLIEPVRTLTAIDVNSAGAVAERGLERTALAVNLAAAREIPRQLALRNIGGTIVIDFIDLENRNKREQVLAALREAVGIDPAIEWVGNMSRLGLVELSRRRTGRTLAEMWRGGDA